MTKEEFIKELEKLNIILDEEKLDKLNIYANFLIEYNEHTNLTAIKDINSIYLKHFYDSLTITRNINLSKEKTLVDVGCGAGFPGVVLKIVYPNLKVVLLDSNNKKVKFVMELIKKLNLKDIIAINMRSEEYAIKHLDVYDVVTARAVTDLVILTELCLPMVKVGGYFIPLKADAKEEINHSKDIINILNGKIEYIDEFMLPQENSIRTIIKIKKVGKNPAKYPRPFGIIKKSLKKYQK